MAESKGLTQAREAARVLRHADNVAAELEGHAALDAALACIEVELQEARQERDNAHAYAERIAKKHEALSILFDGPNSRLPQDVRDRAKLGAHVAEAAADLLIELAHENAELRIALAKRGV